MGTDKVFAKLLEFGGFAARNESPKSTWHGSPEYRPQAWSRRLSTDGGKMAPERQHREEQNMHHTIGSMKTQRDVGLTGLGAYGVYRGANKARELISGRTTLFHGTDKPGFEAISKHGLRSGARTGRKGITDLALSGDRLAKSKKAVFLTRTPITAHEYGAQAEWLRAGAPGGLFGRAVAPLHRRGGTVKFSVPLWRKGLAKHVIENPEVGGAKHGRVY